MNEETKRPHDVIIEERKNMSVSGVNDVDSFDEKEIRAYTDMGMIRIKGEGLHIDRLSVESGELKVDGRIDVVEYSGESRTSKGMFAKIFK